MPPEKPQLQEPPAKASPQEPPPAVAAAGEEALRPQISVTSPLQGSLYGARVLVRGKAAAPGGLELLTYSIRSPEVFAEAGAAPESPAKLGADGSFSMVVVTRGLKGPQELHLKARDREGREGECSVSLLPAEGDIAGFRVEPGDGRLTLSWDPLPGAGSYTLLYRIENPGQPPGGERQLNVVRPPYALAGLENGNVYASRLKTAIAGEADAWSATKTAVPFSPDTLALAAQGEYRRIRLSWKPIPACESYEIWRATAADGTYGQVAGPVTGGAYLDEDVRYGTKYFYQVRPTGLPSTGSRIARAQVAELPEQRVEACGFCSLAGARGIYGYGAYLFAAAGSAGLQIIDVADLNSPAVVGSCPTESANAVVVRGELACLADGEHGLATVDVSDPRSPRFLGARKTTEARAVYLKDNQAFVADGSGGLKVLDVSSPSQPTRLASLETQDAWDLVGRGDLLYLADGRGGFLTVDIADPRAPVPLGRLQSPAARAVALCGSLVLLADGEQGLRVIDVSRPAQPVYVGSHSLRGAVDVACSGQLAFVAGAAGGITVVDLSDPHRPVPTGSIGGGQVRAVAVGEDCAFVVDERGLSTLRALAQGRSYPVASAGTDSKAFRITLSGQFAYVAGHAAGVSVIDLSSPAAVGPESLVAACPTEYALDVAVGDGRLYVADGRRGLKVVELSPGSAPVLQAELYTGGEASGVALSGNLLYVAAGAEGLKVVDVANPREPAQIAESPSRDARDVAAMGDRVLVADAEEGLLLFDVSDPAVPRRAALLLALRGSRLALRGANAFLVGPTGLHAVELARGSEPRHLGSYETPHAEDVALDGTYAYLAEGVRGLTVLDVSRPGSPRPVSACPEVYAVGVAARGEYAFVADTRSLQVIRILIPEWLRRQP